MRSYRARGPGGAAARRHRPAAARRRGGPGATGPGAHFLCAPATPARTSLGCLPDGSDESRCGPPVGGIRGCEGGPQGPSSLRAACGAPRARETRASPRKWRGRAGSHASLQVFASYEEDNKQVAPRCGPPRVGVRKPAREGPAGTFSPSLWDCAGSKSSFGVVPRPPLAAKRVSE